MPRGMPVVVRVNPVGVDRFKAGQPVPAGTVVVKEKYPAVLPEHTAGRSRRDGQAGAGYDPENGDWEYAYEQRWPEAERKVVRGKLRWCIELPPRRTGHRLPVPPLLASIPIGILGQRPSRWSHG